MRKKKTPTPKSPPKSSRALRTLSADALKTVHGGGGGGYILIGGKTGVVLSNGGR